MCNSSCVTLSQVRANVGNAVVCVALRNIRAGEEVTENYGVHHTEDSAAARHKILVKNYGFECRFVYKLCRSCATTTTSEGRDS